MSLPAIAPYRFDPGVIPLSRAGWAPDPARSALLVHDLQTYFIQAFDRSDDQAQVNVAVRRIAELLQAARRLEIPVAYTAQPPRQDLADRALLTDLWGPGMQTEEQAAILEELAPQPGDLVIEKWRYSAFIRTSLERQLRVRGRDQLMVTGVYAHIGCLSTCLDAFMRDIQPFLVADALADFTAEDHAMAVDYAAQRCARVLGTDQLIRAWGGTAGQPGEKRAERPAGQGALR